jgi:hypothetical protein
VSSIETVRRSPSRPNVLQLDLRKAGSFLLLKDESGRELVHWERTIQALIAGKHPSLDVIESFLAAPEASLENATPLEQAVAVLEQRAMGVIRTLEGCVREEAGPHGQRVLSTAMIGFQHQVFIAACKWGQLSLLLTILDLEQAESSSTSDSERGEADLLPRTGGKFRLIFKTLKDQRWGNILHLLVSHDNGLAQLGFTVEESDVMSRMFKARRRKVVQALLRTTSAQGRATLLEMVNRDGLNPALLAARDRELDLLDLLTDAGAEVHVDSRHGTTVSLLHYAVLKWPLADLMARAHLFTPGDYSAPNKDGVTPLSLYLSVPQEELLHQDQRTQLVRFLLREGAEVTDCRLGKAESQALSGILEDVMRTDPYARFELLKRAVELGDSELCQLIMYPLKSNHAVPLPFMELGSVSLLRLCCGSTHRRAPAILDLLCQYQPGPDRLREAQKRSPPSGRGEGGTETDALPAELRFAKPRYEVSIDSQDEHGFTALVMAIHNPNSQVSTKLTSRLLELRDANIHATDTKGRQALHHAVAANHNAALELLLQCHCNLESKYEGGHTALHLASHQGHWRMLGALLKAGATVDQANDSGYTPLALAMMSRFEVKELQRVCVAGDASAEVEAGSLVTALLPQSPASGSQDPFPTFPEDAAVASVSLSRFPGSRKKGGEHGSQYAPLDSLPTYTSVHRPEVVIQELRLVLPTGDLLQLCQVLRRAEEAGLTAHVEYLDAIEEKANLLTKLETYGSDIDRCIEALLQQQASLKEATRYGRLADFTNWTSDFVTIHVTINSLRLKCDRLEHAHHDKVLEKAKLKEAKYRPHFQETKYQGLKASLGELEADIGKLQSQEREVFLGKLNQIVINQGYRKIVRHRHFARLLWYSVFLLVLTLVGVYETARSETSAHFFHSSFNNIFVQDEIDVAFTGGVPKTFMGIDDHSEFYEWLNGNFLQIMYQAPVPFYDAGVLRTRRPGYIMGQTKVLGVPRLRQIRSETVLCDVPLDFIELAGDYCFKDVGAGVLGSSYAEDTQPFGPISGLNSQGVWAWAPPEAIGGFPYWGHVSDYPGGGFVQDFPHHSDPLASTKATALAQTLQAQNWIDARTRAVFVEFNVFNPSADHFGINTLLVEFSLSGAVVPSSKFDVNRISRHEALTDNLYVGIEFAFLLVIIIYTALEVRKLATFRRRYFDSWYSCLDFLMLILFSFIVSIHLYTMAVGFRTNWSIACLWLASGLPLA